jgi:hypothetical protein
MKIPSKINISGVPWTVNLALDIPGDMGMYGKCDYTARTITVYQSGCPMTDMQTFWHELLHALSWAYGLQLDDTEDKHQRMDVLSCVLVDTFTRNGMIKI